MNIEVTVINEQKIVEQFRASLRREARRLVADAPDRIGRRYAGVTFADVEFVHFFDKGFVAAGRIQWT